LFSGLLEVLLTNQMIIPQHIFKNILEYCDDSVERRQRKLWESITVTHDGDMNWEPTSDMPFGGTREKPKRDITWITVCVDNDRKILLAKTVNYITFMDIYP